MLYGVVLAGGASRRMGQDKALMQFQGRTLITHASHLLEAAGCKSVLVSRNEAGHVIDKIENAGPLGGVHGAVCEILKNAPCKTMKNGEEEVLKRELLVLPVDMPKMTSQLLNQLVSLGRQNERACFVENRFLPFYLPISSNTQEALNDYLVNQGKRRVIGFLEHVNALALSSSSVENEAQWLNVNTPNDWPTNKPHPSL